MSPESTSGRPVELFESDFDLDFYDPSNLSEVETHVRSFFGEKLMKPRRERLWVGNDGTLDPNYVAMMEKSISYWSERGDTKAVQRFEKELDGARNAVNLIIDSSELGEPLPIVINASDPGDFYVDKEGRRKSVTFVWMKESSEDKGWRYSVYSIPTKHIGLEKHWDLLKKLGDVQRTQDILKKMFNEDELSANSLIAFPLVVTNLSRGMDAIADELGYPTWDEINQIAADQLAMEEDLYAKERREQIVIEFTARIFYAVKDGRPKEYKEALVSAMSDTMALEAGSRDYLGKNKEQITNEIDKNVRLALAIKYKVFEKKSYYELKDLGVRFGDLGDLYKHYQWVSTAFNTNPLAREARATGCGGSGSTYGSDMFSSRDFAFQDVSNLIESQSFYSDTTESITTATGGEEPEGRYLEGIYKPGHCRACDTDRKKVWHKEDGGCDCCTTCEHRLAGGD
ncbi:MAG: hypothetical protein WAV40_05335 [Microgenomates group bacterium]